jgi:hypothetical protein
VSLKSEKGKEPLVRLATAPNEMIASLWKGILEENGINSMLKSVSFMESAQYTRNVFPYEIYVLASEADKAREILTPFLEDNST